MRAALRGRATLAAVAFAMVFSMAGISRAEGQQTQGFAVERFYPSAPGGGWFVMDDLQMHGGFGGAIELTTGYAQNPLVLAPPGGGQLPVVSNEAYFDVGAAVTYDRFRLYLNLPSPVRISGASGTVGGYHYTGPNVNLAENPDTISDARLGFDVRLLGEPGGLFRAGLSAQLLFPSGSVADYDTDGTYRAMLRFLFAGNGGLFSYAGQLGVHIRPLNEPDVPGAPRGSELLFGVAAGPRLALGRRWAFVVGPEIYGETAFDAFFGRTTTGLEALLGARIEGTGPGPQLRVKLGGGGGLDPNFGAPQWRVVLAVELFNNGLEQAKSGK